MPNNIETIKQRIRKTFGDVPFPEHCGIKAAIAMDDWISDPVELKKITASQDVKGKWWEIPFEEMKLCLLASSYFDAESTEFYLPAYMVAVLDDPCYPKYNCLINWLTPGEKDDECDLYEYFLEQFAKINGTKKIVCVEVLKYIRAHLDPTDIFSEDKINDILSHDFWNTD